MKIKLERLEAACKNLFLQAGVSGEDAEIISEVLITTEIMGIKSHGLMRVEKYIDCLVSGGIKPRAKIIIERETPVSVSVNGGGGPGPVISYNSMNLAIEKAVKTGIGMVNVNNSHHFGAAGFYAMMCARRDMIGIAMSNGDPVMAVPGGSSRAIGNNPFSYALPAEKYKGVLFDIAMSKMADGKIQIAKALGRQIAEGAILDSRGEPSTDPDDYLEGGALLPFGEHKGYGLALMVECLAGVLSDAAITDDISAWNKDPERSGNTGHFFMAIDINTIMPADKFKKRTKELIERITSSSGEESAGKILYPGQRELESEAEARKTGFAVLEESCVESLERTASRLKTQLSLE